MVYTPLPGLLHHLIQKEILQYIQLDDMVGKTFYGYIHCRYFQQATLCRSTTESLQSLLIVGPIESNVRGVQIITELLM